MKLSSNTEAAQISKEAVNNMLSRLRGVGSYSKRYGLP